MDLKHIMANWYCMVLWCIGLPQRNSITALGYPLSHCSSTLKVSKHGYRTLKLIPLICHLSRFLVCSGIRLIPCGKSVTSLIAGEGLCKPEFCMLTLLPYNKEHSQFHCSKSTRSIKGSDDPIILFFKAEN